MTMTNLTFSSKHLSAHLCASADMCLSNLLASLAGRSDCRWMTTLVSSSVEMSCWSAMMSLGEAVTVGSPEGTVSFDGSDDRMT